MLDLGAAAAPTLAQRLERHANAPGAQAALFALGCLGNLEVVPFLCRRAEQDDALAAEAALALGRLTDPRARQRLELIAGDRQRDAANRTAAACALLDLGATEVAAPLLAAVLLAGTPYGRDAAARHGLPDRPRWALERSMAIAAIERHTGQTFGLDQDASWPQLRDGTAAFSDWIDGH